MSNEVVYDQYGNTIRLRLQVDGVDVADHRVITRAIVEFGRGETILSPDPYLVIDSSIDPTSFDLTDPTAFILKLGAASVPKGRHNVFLTVFLPAYTDGLSFGTALGIAVK